MKTGRILLAAMVGFAMTLSASMASAQLNSGAQTIALNANLTESLTLTLSLLLLLLRPLLLLLLWLLLLRFLPFFLLLSSSAASSSSGDVADCHDDAGGKPGRGFA